MDIPNHIEFQGDSERILRSTLLAVTPEEGCALLIGKSTELQNQSKPKVFKIHLIWPCCNVWIDAIHNLNDKYLETKTKMQKKISRENRFLLDPYEQLSAQKWARSKQLIILGAAHSHPLSSPIPSKVDLSSSFSPGLMIILNGSTTEMKAWWINDPNISEPIAIPWMSLKSKQ